jgi:hypothetical protein
VGAANLRPAVSLVTLRCFKSAFHYGSGQPHTFVAKGSTCTGRLPGRERIGVWSHPSVDHTLLKNRASLCLQNRDEIDDGNVGIVFLALCRRQLAFITFICKLINTGLCLLINTKIDETPGNFRGEKRSKRIKKAVEYASSNRGGMISHR